MLYRVKQFIWAIKSLFQEVDNDYVNKLLDKREKRLFNKLKKSDKQHCIRVSTVSYTHLRAHET